jgi:hypothetical protein
MSLSGKTESSLSCFKTERTLHGKANWHYMIPEAIAACGL